MLARSLAALLAAASLTGCLAHAAYDVATVPVRATSKVVDWTTTSRSEADRNLGRKVRREREQHAREDRRARKAERREAKREREAMTAPPPD